MKKTLLYLVLSLLISFPLFAQLDSAALDTTYWTNSLNANVAFNQASFSDSWKGGGVNSVALGMLLNMKAKYEKAKVSFVNEAEFQYGLINNRGQGFRKSVDRLLIDSKLGYSVAPKWNMFVSGNFLSQFANGFRYEQTPQGQQAILISRFMSPGFLTMSLGMEFKPTDYFWLRLSPFSPRFTFVNDMGIFPNVPENYGVPMGERVRSEWAAFQMVADIDKQLNSTLNIKSRYTMFVNYEELEMETIDHRLDLIITAKVTKYINVSLNAIVLYDKDQDDEVQLSQGLAVGFAYTMQNR